MRFRLRLAKYEYVAYHVPGKSLDLYTADALSRALLTQTQGRDEEELQEEVEVYIDSITLPSTRLHHRDCRQSPARCAREAHQKKKPPLPMPLPEYLWQVMATDLFKLAGKQY